MASLLPSFETRPYQFLAALFIICLQLSREGILVRGDVGTAMSYGPPYTPTKCHGSRQDQFPAGRMFVAVSHGLWNNGAACGRKYWMRCIGGVNRPCRDGTVINVVVVDLCPDPCRASILLSVDAFAAISSAADARVIVEYKQH